MVNEPASEPAGDILSGDIQSNDILSNAIETTGQALPPEAGVSLSPEPAFSLPPIAGFWRRFFAWMIDSLLIGAIGQVFALLFSSFLFGLGPYGRPLGLLIVIPYFGLFNSSLGDGQTLGKRLLKIAVRDKNNQPIGLGRSILRILILWLPVLFNGWVVTGLIKVYAIQWLIGVLVFGLGGAIFYTMLFNRKARQGIHDLLLGTYVVHLPGKPIAAFPITPRVHWIVASAWVGIAAVGILVLAGIAPSIMAAPRLAAATDLYSLLQSDSRFFSTGVNDLTSYSSIGKSSRSLTVTVWYKGSLDLDQRKEVAQSVAKTILENAKDINTYDGLQVSVTTAYDIGVASGHVNMSFAHSIEEWRKEVHVPGS